MILTEVGTDMAGTGDSDPPADARAWARVGLLLAFALLVRLAFFTGMSYGDDVIYASQVVSHVRSASWPPEASHWGTRLGLTLPTALSVGVLGMRPIAFVLWPLLAGLVKVLACLGIAGSFVDRRTSYLAATFLAAFPLEVIFSSHLFPDVVVGLFSTLSLWAWIRALRRDDARDYFLSGLAFAAGYLCRETVLMDGPIYLALWALEGRIRRPRMAWVALAPVLVLALEMGTYAATAGSPLYRWAAIRSQQGSGAEVANIRSSQAGGNFWTDPLMMAATSHEYGLYFGPSLVVALLAFRRWPSCRPLAAWLLVGFLWIYYGTMSPSGWLTLPREPRYGTVLTVPCVILLARSLTSLDRRVGWPLAALLLASGLAAAGLDRGSAAMAPHKAFLASPYATGAAVEPFDYAASRWLLGFGERPGFACATGCGRGSIVRSMAAQPGTTSCRWDRARYFVFSSYYRPDLLKTLTARGWKQAAEFPGRPGASRAMIARLLMAFPSQRKRADRLRHPPGLVVLERPGGPDSADGVDGTEAPARRGGEEARAGRGRSAGSMGEAGGDR